MYIKSIQLVLISTFLFSAESRGPDPHPDFIRDLVFKTNRRSDAAALLSIRK